MKIKLTKAWRNSRTGERFAVGTELELEDAQAKKLVDAGFAIAVVNQDDGETTQSIPETTQSIPETTQSIPETNPAETETTPVVIETSSGDNEAAPEPEPVSAETIPAEEVVIDGESRRMRRRREAHEAN